MAAIIESKTRSNVASIMYKAYSADSSQFHLVVVIDRSIERLFSKDAYPCCINFCVVHVLRAQSRLAQQLSDHNTDSSTWRPEHHV
jgi:hypothetical protein